MAGLTIALWLASFGETRIYARNLVNPNAPASPKPLEWAGLSNDHFWIPFFYLVTVGCVAMLFTIFIRHQRRTGSRHPGLPLYLAFCLGPFLDPIINWGMYAVYYPKLFHWPITWPLASISPTVEPLWVMVAYQLFFLPVALGLFTIHRKLTSRAKPDSWTVRHPAGSLFLFAGVLGMGADILMEMWMLNMHIYNYTQIAGPYLSWGHGNLQLVEIVWIGLWMGGLAVMLRRDDRGRSLCARLAQTSPRLRRLRLGEIGTAFVIVGLGLCLYCGTFAGLRLAGLAKPVPTPYPFRTVKTYDPDGRMEKAGQPGAYFDGIWCTSRHCGTHSD